MNNGSIRIVNPGPLSLIQDQGRAGFQSLGVSVSGAVDIDSMLLGNRLVGNASDLAGIEVMIGGLSLEFNKQTIFALTGANTYATLDGVLLGTNVSYVAHTGSLLELGMATDGLRSYISIAGGIDVPKTLGSRSTHVASQIGGVMGRKLESGDVLNLGESDKFARSGLSQNFTTDLNLTSLAIRVVLGPQDNLFSDIGIHTFLESEYTITEQSNRQGLRLGGPIIESKSGVYDIISDAVVNGSVQIPGDGMPIVLLADRQTTGGYAKIATVASVDLPILGQVKPGMELSFVSISVEEAQDALNQKMKLLEGTPIVDVVEDTAFFVNGSQTNIGVSENDGAELVSIDGAVYPVSVEEIHPAI